MRPYLAIAAPITALALAACGSKGSVEANNESAASVAEKASASGLKPRPGRWETAMKIEKFEMPGTPPQLQAQMQKQMGAIKTFSSCLTAEEVNRPNAGFFGSRDPGCTYQRFAMAGGQIDAEMTCSRSAGRMHMTVKGAYGEDTYAVRVTNEGAMAPGKTMSMTMALDSRRVGECVGKEQ